MRIIADRLNAGVGILSVVLCLATHALELPAQSPPRGFSVPRLEVSGETDSGKKGTKAAKWTDLFDGKSLTGWKSSEFGGDGDIRIAEGAIILESGVPFTGVEATRKMPQINYEFALKAKRVDGHDFFCGLTFPVGKTFCSLIVGGWGGGLVGVSCLDGADASDNETGQWVNLKTGKWYEVRLRVTDRKIEAWLDETKVVDVETEGRQIDIRADISPSKPFGICSWRTTAALREIRIRSLSPASKTVSP